MTTKPKIVVLTGAGISAESGLKTFRDHDGLWENYRIEEVATPQAWATDPQMVMDFYNARRRNVLAAKPNTAHLALVQLEEVGDVHIITQNIDDLHERAGSHQVLHLHGEIVKLRSTQYPQLVYQCNGDQHMKDVCEKGSRLRPHIVWFGEEVPMMESAIEVIQEADIVIIVGTSMQVYPAAGLLSYAPLDTEVYYIDPNPAESLQFSGRRENLHILAQKAGTGVLEVVERISKKHRKS